MQQHCAGTHEQSAGTVLNEFNEVSRCMGSVKAKVFRQYYYRGKAPLQEQTRRPNVMLCPCPSCFTWSKFTEVSGITPTVSEKVNLVQVTELLPQSYNATAKHLCKVSGVVVSVWSADVFELAKVQNLLLICTDVLFLMVASCMNYLLWCTYCHNEGTFQSYAIETSSWD